MFLTLPGLTGDRKGSALQAGTALPMAEGGQGGTEGAGSRGCLGQPADLLLRLLLPDPRGPRPAAAGKDWLLLLQATSSHRDTGPATVAPPACPSGNSRGSRWAERAEISQGVTTPTQLHPGHHQPPTPPPARATPKTPMVGHKGGSGGRVNPPPPSSTGCEGGPRKL